MKIKQSSLSLLGKRTTRKNRLEGVPALPGRQDLREAHVRHRASAVRVFGVLLRPRFADGPVIEGGFKRRAPARPLRVSQRQHHAGQAKGGSTDKKLCRLRAKHNFSLEKGAHDPDAALGQERVLHVPALRVGAQACGRAGDGLRGILELRDKLPPR